MSIKQITQLPASTTLASTDVLAKETSGNTTQKITAENAVASLKTIGNLLGTNDVINNLTTGGTTVPLSAEMGKKLQNEKQAKIEDAGVSFTPASGITSNLFIRRYGNVVCINGYLQSSTNFTTSETVVGNIGSVDRPSAILRLPAHTADQAYNVGTPAYVAISTNGNIVVTAASGTAHKYCYFTAAYIV